MQVEPNPAEVDPASPAPRKETAEARDLLPTTPDEAHPDAQWTRPDGATPDTATVGPPMPPLAAGSDVEHIGEAYNPEAEEVPTGQEYPELELGVDGLNLGDSDSDSEEPPMKKSTPAATTNPMEVPAHGSISTPDEVEMEERGEPLHEQPGLQIGERRVQIKDVGLF